MLHVLLTQLITRCCGVDLCGWYFVRRLALEFGQQRALPVGHAWRFNLYPPLLAFSTGVTRVASHPRRPYARPGLIILLVPGGRSSARSR